MTKQSNAEAAVRSAAQTLHDAIVKARSEGLVVTWPSRCEALPAVAISETGKAKMEVSVQAETVAPAVALKATAAAQKAADKVIEKAEQN